MERRLLSIEQKLKLNFNISRKERLFFKIAALFVYYASVDLSEIDVNIAIR